MQKVARTVYLPIDLDSMVVGMSEKTHVTTADIIRECVKIAQTEGIVRSELLRRLVVVKATHDNTGDLSKAIGCLKKEQDKGRSLSTKF